MSATWKYVVAFLLLIQLGLGFVVPTRWLFDYRVPYESFKDDPRILDLALDHIERRIKQEGLTNYIVLLGDSVAYSGPGAPDQSIGFYMEELSRQAGEPVTVFNLAEPAMQMGDIYTVLLKLQQRGIATDRVVINLLYAGFVARNPSPPIAFWLANDLKQLDPESWKRVEKNLADNGKVPTDRTLSDLFDQYITPHISLLAYRPVIQDKVMKLIRSTPQETYDTRPWTAKPELPQIMAEPMYQQAFAPTAFDMTERNPQIYFLERMIERTQGSRPIIYLTPMNQVLMKSTVSQPGYQENLDRIDAWFEGQPVTYLNLENSMEDQFFADHVHLTPEGYRGLAKLLLTQLGEGR